MNSLSSASPSSPYHALISNVSCLFGVLVFLQQMWGHATIEHTLLTAIGSGLASYLILAVGYAAARGVIAHGPPPEKNASEPSSEQNAQKPSPEKKDEAPQALADDSSAETSPEPTESIPERQAA